MSDEVKKLESNEQNLFTEGLLIAFLTLMSYAAAYCFEWGYADFFGIPGELISISIDMCLRAGVGIVGLLCYHLVMSNLILLPHQSLLKHSDTLLKRLLRVTLVLVIAYIIVDISFGFPMYVTIVVVIALSFFNLILIFPVAMIHRWFSEEKKSLDEHLEAVLVSGGPITTFSYAKRVIGNRQFNLILICLLGLVFAYLAGYYNARKSRYFLVTDSENKVLVRNYGDTFIFKGFDPSKTALLNEFTIVGLDELSKMSLKRVTMKKVTTVAIGELPNPEPKD